jgi:hypothetical protein
VPQIFLHPEHSLILSALGATVADSDEFASQFCYALNLIQISGVEQRLVLLQSDVNAIGVAMYK